MAFPATFKTEEREMGDPFGKKKQVGFFERVGIKSSAPCKEMEHLWVQMGDVEKWIKNSNVKFARRSIDALIEGLEDLKSKYPLESK